MSKKFLIVSFCLNCFSICFAQTVISEFQKSVWDKSLNPIIIADDITIPKDSVLTINAGCDIKFDGHYSITIHGTLKANGSPEDSISFSALHPDSTWAGLLFVDADSVCFLQYCILENSFAKRDSLDGAGGAIFCKNTDLKLDHSVLRNNSAHSSTSDWNGGAVTCVNSNPVFQHNIFKGNSGFGGPGGGIFIIDSNPDIRHTLFEQNFSAADSTHVSHGGAVCLYKSPALFSHNLFFSNSGFSASAVYMEDCDRSIFRNNTAVLNTASKNYPSALRLQGITENNIIYHNTLNNDEYGQIEADDFHTRYNDIERSPFIDDGLSFDLDPQFVDLASFDFHLAPTSPCIDAGNPQSGFDLEPEYNGNRINLGCYGNTVEATRSAPEIIINPTRHDFGTEYLGNTKQMDFTIKNTGKSRLNGRIYSTSDAFILKSDSTFSILGKDSIKIKYKFTPAKTQLDSAQIVIKSNTPSDSIKNVLLSGKGVLGGEFAGRLMKKYSPFIVSENLLVPEGKTLTIEGGTTLQADSGVGFTIKGALQTLATSQDSIHFTSSLKEPYPGAWQGIRFDHKEKDLESNIAYCRFSFANAALYFYIYESTVSHCLFEHCKEYFINADMCKGNGYVITDNRFNNAKRCINISMTSGLIENNLIENSVQGINVMGNAVIQKNVLKNLISGIVIDSRGTIKDNIIIGRPLEIDYQSRMVGLLKRNDMPMEGFNAKHGFVLTEGDSVDLYLLDMNTLGHPDRDCIQIVDTRFNDLSEIPLDGYQSQATLSTLGTIVFKTSDGGYAKIGTSRTGTFGSNEGYRIFYYVYVPPGSDRFPTHLDGYLIGLPFAKNGITLSLAAATITNNEIRNFTDYGIYCRFAEIDSFYHNKIQENMQGGILFHGPAFPYANQNIMFNAGTDENQTNMIFDNHGYNFANCNTKGLDLPYIYWGTSDSLEIAKSLFDGNDYPGLGKINFSPFNTLLTVSQPSESTTSRNPKSFTLLPSYPNPFNQKTTIKYYLPKHSRVLIDILNSAGQHVLTLVEGVRESGYHSVQWDATGWSSGIYFIKMNTGPNILTQKCLLLK